MVGVYQHAREREKRGKRKKVELQTREWVPSGLVITAIDAVIQSLTVVYGLGLIHSLAFLLGGNWSPWRNLLIETATSSPCKMYSMFIFYDINFMQILWNFFMLFI